MKSYYLCYKLQNKMKEENESYREFLMSEKKPIDFWFLKIKKKKF
jgi:hypothetical protein